jgi:hypothetical protein
MAPITPEQLTLFAEDSPVSRGQLQDSNEAKKMKDISGRRCCELYEKSGRNGSWPKKFLGLLNQVSTPLPHKWKLKATPSGRL